MPPYYISNSTSLCIGETHRGIPTIPLLIQFWTYRDGLKCWSSMLRQVGCQNKADWDLDVMARIWKPGRFMQVWKGNQVSAFNPMRNGSYRWRSKPDGLAEASVGQGIASKTSRASSETAEVSKEGRRLAQVAQHILEFSKLHNSATISEGQHRTYRFGNIRKEKWQPVCLYCFLKELGRYN